MPAALPAAVTAKTITRFAPSPTGHIHIGNLRPALLNYMIARKAGGTFILRLDDTDPERSKQEYVDGIMRDLDWLGLHWDRVERQSLRLERYHDAADQLRGAGRFYECFESAVELDLKRKKQLNMGKPPVYDRASLKLTATERDARRAEVRAAYNCFDDVNSTFYPDRPVPPRRKVCRPPLAAARIAERIRPHAPPRAGRGRVVHRLVRRRFR